MGSTNNSLEVSTKVAHDWLTISMTSWITCQKLFIHDEPLNDPTLVRRNEYTCKLYGSPHNTNSHVKCKNPNYLHGMLDIKQHIERTLSPSDLTKRYYLLNLHFFLMQSNTGIRNGR